MSDTDNANAQAGGTPSQEQLSQQGQQQSSPVDAATLQAKISQLESEINSLRSGKDKAVAKTNKRLSDFETQLARYETLRAKLDPEDAMFRMKAEALFGEGGEEEKPADAGDAGKKSLGVDAETLAVLGIEPSDPGVTELLLQGKTSLQDFIDYAKLLRQKRTGQSPKPSTVFSVGSGMVTTSEEEKASLSRAYSEELKLIRPGDVWKFTELKKKYRAKGLEVW